MTGGCNKNSKEPSNFSYIFRLPSTIRKMKRVNNLLEKRYGHASILINQQVIVMGGFFHNDDDFSQPQTLNSCERYNYKDNEWIPIAPMNQCRAFFSGCKVKDEFLYVFGGFMQYETTSSIEFYNTMLDKWTILTISLPLKLAKYGLCKVEENQIILAGGLMVEGGTSTS